MPSAPAAPRRGFLLADLAALAAAAALVLFHHLGATSLLGDETIYARVAWQAAFRGQWMPPRYNAAIFLEKPPLRQWAVALLFRLFGPSEWTARGLDAALGVATVAAVYLAGRALFGRRAGAVAALLLLGAHHLFFVHGLRDGVQESALLLTLSAALLAYLLGAGRAGPAGMARADVAAGLLTAASLLVKNAMGLLVLGVTGLFELIFAGNSGARGWRRLLPRRPLRVLALTLAVYLPWVAAAWLASGGRYFAILHHDVVQRATGSLVSHPVRYPRQLLGDFGPALGLLALAPLFAVRAWRRGRGAEGDPEAEREAAAVVFLGLWAGIVLAVLSAAASKLEWYIYPAYPAVALLAGYAADRALAGLGRRRRAMALLGEALLAAYLGVEVLHAWRAGSAYPARIDADQVARQVAAAGRPLVCLDPRLMLREWNVYYLMPLVTRLVTTPAEAAPCAVLLTDDPGRLATGRPPLPPARVYRFHNFDATEQDTYAVDLAGRLRLDRIRAR